VRDVDFLGVNQALRKADTLLMGHLIKKMPDKEGARPAQPQASDKLNDTPKHVHCFYCSKVRPEAKEWDYTPCQQCKIYMQMGVVVILIEDGTVKKPKRVGFHIIPDEAAKSFLPPKAYKDRCVFMENSEYNKRFGSAKVIPTS
jgi:hypothetical protein